MKRIAKVFNDKLKQDWLQKDNSVKGQITQIPAFSLLLSALS